MQWRAWEGWQAKLRASSQRFFIAVLFCALLFMVQSYWVWSPQEALKLELSRLSWALQGSLCFAVFWQVLLERVSWGSGKLGEWSQLLSPLSLAAFYYLWQLVALPYYIMHLAGIMLALACFTYYLVGEEQNDKVLFPYLVESCGLTLVAEFAMMLGIGICLLAYHTLLSSLASKWYMIGVCLACILSVLVFLTRIPRPQEAVELSLSKGNFILKIALATYCFLLLILYCYLGKLALQRVMPVGMLNPFASLATFFFLYFAWSVQRPEAFKYGKQFIRYGAILLLPIIAVQLWGISIRHQAYGLTVLRYASMLCVGFGVVAIANSLLQKPVRNMALLLGGLSLLATATPLNLIDVPSRQQQGRLQQTLEAHQLWQGGKVVANGEKLSTRDYEIIRGAADYLRNSISKGKYPFIAAATSKEALGIYREQAGAAALAAKTQKQVLLFDSKLSETVLISGFKEMATVSYYTASSPEAKQVQGPTITWTDGTKQVYPLNSYVEQLIKEYQDVAPSPVAQAQPTALGEALIILSKDGKTKTIKLASPLRYSYDDQTTFVFRSFTIYIAVDGTYGFNGTGYALRK